MMDLLSIRRLKQQLGPVPSPVRVHSQLERSSRRATKNGEPYYELTFADSQEKLILRVWNNTPMFFTASQLMEGQFYEISGEFALGNDGRSIDGKSWSTRSLEEQETATLLLGSAELREKQERDYRYIEEAIARTSDPRLHALGSLCLQKFGTRFKRTGGARDFHHARRGGLVEHVSYMIRLSEKMAEVYDFLNRDLMVIGALFHDIGKLWENAYEDKGFSMPFTEVSELLTHIPLGMEIVNKLWRELTEDAAAPPEWDQLEPPSSQVRLHLLHLVASHHGELAFGSPVVPKTPEAQALHYIDNIDAKMEMFTQGYQTSPSVARHIYERVRPLTAKLVAPLPHFQAPVDESPAAPPVREHAPDYQAPVAEVKEANNERYQQQPAEESFEAVSPENQYQDRPDPF